MNVKGNMAKFNAMHYNFNNPPTHVKRSDLIKYTELKQLLNMIFLLTHQEIHSLPRNTCLNTNSSLL